MSWRLENNLLVLRQHDGSDIYPSASILSAQMNNDSFDYEGSSYPSPFAELGLRASGICLYARLSFTYNNGVIRLALLAQKAGSCYEVPLFGDTFASYVIIGTTWYRLQDSSTFYNEFVAEKNIDIRNVAYVQYITLRNYLDSQGYPYDDLVADQVQDIKYNYKHFVAEGLQGKLFEYQDCGCNWLSFMTNNHCGCILGDEMGLGKTLQIITLFGSHKESNPDAHFLVVCPVSLLINWQREIAKFYPSLSVLVHHGSHRTGIYEDFYDYDVVITSYSNAQSDRSILNMLKWDIVVLDEAQNIKNPSAKRTKAMKEISRDVAIAVTGTPFENHMTDIWSIVDFVIPGFLGKLSQFEIHFPDTIDSAQELEQIISPIMIRRRVLEVAKDLPERMDVPVPIEMTPEEAKYYETGRRKILDDADLMSMSLDKIQGLRMFCTHPLVYDPTLGVPDPITISNKYDRLCAILEEIFEQGEKAIVFTSFNKMIEIMVNDIRRRFGVYTNYINGSVDSTSRQKIIDEFSARKGPGMLALNPRAAGAGLNITAANHAIHYNLEWNPAIEDQASARVYRRGQDKPVFIYRLYYTDTIEEIINGKIQNKRSISDTAIIGNLGNSISQEELLQALSVTPYKS